MRAIVIALVFVAVFKLSGFISNGNATVQTAAVILCGLVVVWYGMRAICCACNQKDKPSCSKDRSDEQP